MKLIKKLLGITQLEDEISRLKYEHAKDLSRIYKNIAEDKNLLCEINNYIQYLKTKSDNN
jgi:hypothetical protein